MPLSELADAMQCADGPARVLAALLWRRSTAAGTGCLWGGQYRPGRHRAAAL